MMFSGLDRNAELTPPRPFQFRKKTTRRGCRGGHHHNKSASKAHGSPGKNKALKLDKPRFAAKTGAEFVPCMTSNHGFALQPVVILKRPSNTPVPMMRPQQQQRGRPRSTTSRRVEQFIIRCNTETCDDVSVVSSRSSSFDADLTCDGHISSIVRPYQAVLAASKRSDHSNPTCFIELDDSRDGEPCIFRVSFETGDDSSTTVDLNDTEIVDFCKALLEYSEDDPKRAWVF
jgi:hypothetical protein